MKIVFTNPDGSIGIVNPVLGCGLTVAQIAKKDVPTGVQYWIVDDSEVPEDRTFRNAWQFETDKQPDGVGD